MNENDALLVVEARRAVIDGTAKEIRRASGLSQAEIALACGVTPQAVTRWEGGSRLPRGSAAVRYARLLGRLRAAAGANR